MLNDLDAARAQGQGKPAFAEALDGLLDYVKIHFKAEEQLMQEHGFPDYADHRNAHINMTIKVAELQRIKDKYRESDISDLIAFLTQWLMGHIMGVDKKYGVYLNNKGVF